MESTRKMMCSRVDLEGAREITRSRRAFLALVASPRDGATGPHDCGFARYRELLKALPGLGMYLSRPLAFYVLTSTRV
jgi:hypothetical protein